MLGYKKDFDDKLDDFVWKTVSMKLDKYKPFLLNNINLKKYKQTLKEIVVKWILILGVNFLIRRWFKPVLKKSKNFKI